MDDDRQAQVNAAIALASSLHADGADWDSVLADLRSAGYEMSEAVHATRLVLNLNPGAAVGRVIDSPVWADRREATIAGNEAFRQAMQTAADEWHEDERGWEARFDLTNEGTRQSLTGTDPGLWRLACALALFVVGVFAVVAAVLAYGSYDLVCTPGGDEGCVEPNRVALVVIQLMPLVALGGVVWSIFVAARRETLYRRLATLAGWSASILALTILLTAIIVN